MDLSLAGDVASILGFAAAATLLWGLGRTKSHYTLIGRVPELVDDLKGCASDLSECINNFEGRMPTIEQELANTETVLESIKKNSPREIKKVASRLLKTIKKYDINGTNAKDKVQAIYRDINKLSGKIENLQKDLKWKM